LRSLASRVRARPTRHIQPALGLAVVPLQLGPLERPVDGETVHRLEPQIFDRETVARAAPVQREAPYGHRHRDVPFGLLILDVVVGPWVLAVRERAFAVAAAVLRVEDRPAGLDDGDLQVRT